MKNLLAGGIAAALAVTGVLAPSPVSASPTVPAAPAAAPPATADPAPATRAAAWLAGEVPQSGILSVTYDFGSGPESFPDVGLTIDAAQALDQVGGHDTLVATMTGAIQSEADEGYVTQYGSVAANAAAKASAFLLEQGRTGDEVDTAYAQLQGRVSTTPPIAGRLEDEDTSFGDFASPIGQAYALQAFAERPGAQLATVRSFLLAQQCEAGFFRAGFTTDKTALDQSCDGAPAGQASSSVDTTAITVLALQDLAGTDPEVATALDDAAAWLATVQGDDGSFATGGATGAVNANSTGLAARALSAEDREPRAALAATWLRAHQLDNAGSCRDFAAADNGAVVVDDLGVSNARSGTMDAVDRGVAVRATAQALPALASAPGGRNGRGVTSLTFATAPVRAGSARSVVVRSAPGNVLCTRLGSAAARRVVVPRSGVTTLTVRLPRSTGSIAFTTIDPAGRSARGSILGLWAARLGVSVPPSVKVGGRPVVRVTGLTAGETVTVRFRGRVVAQGTAGRQGMFARRFTVPAGTGRAAVVATGRFADRRGTDTTTVSR